MWISKSTRDLYISYFWQTYIIILIPEVFLRYTLVFVTNHEMGKSFSVNVWIFFLIRFNIRKCRALTIKSVDANLLQTEEILEM